MPANYALHRFGAEAIRTLPEQLRRPVQRFRRLYDSGLHGGDLFFYYRPVMTTPVGELYHTYGSMTGREFFAQACELLKQNPSEGGLACLYGLLGNYCLYSRLAPLCREAMAQSGVSPTELEVELDRHLLCRDGKLPAHRQSEGSDFKMTRGECVTMSLFFPPATAANMFEAYRGMMFWSRCLTAKKRGIAQAVLKTTRGTFAHQRMEDHANHRCLHLDGAMEKCFADALECYPEMARQLTDYREQGTGLGELFDHPFH